MVVNSSVQKSCDLVLNSVRSSHLNFSFQETPFSIYLTVRKSFSKPNFDYNPEVDSKQYINQENLIESLKSNLKSVEEENKHLVQTYEEAVNDSEGSYKRVKELEAIIEGLEQKSVEKEAMVNEKKNEIIDSLKVDKVNLESDLNEAEQSLKNLKKNLKANEKELDEKKKEFSLVTEDLLQVKTELDKQTDQGNRDRKNSEKHQKKAEKKQFLDNLKASPSFDCTLCDVKKESQVSLKTHIVLNHMKVSSTQTIEKVLKDEFVQSCSEAFASEKQSQTVIEETVDNEFEKYPCNYCGINIAGERHLCEQRTKCRGTFLMGVTPGLPRPPMSFKHFPGFPAPPHFSPFGFGGYS